MLTSAADLPRASSIALSSGSPRTRTSTRRSSASMAVWPQNLSGMSASSALSLLGNAKLGNAIPAPLGAAWDAASEAAVDGSWTPARRPRAGRCWRSRVRWTPRHCRRNRSGRRWRRRPATDRSRLHGFLPVGDATSRRAVAGLRQASPGASPGAVARGRRSVGRVDRPGRGQQRAGRLEARPTGRPARNASMRPPGRRGRRPARTARPGGPPRGASPGRCRPRARPRRPAPRRLRAIARVRRSTTWAGGRDRGQRRVTSAPIASYR